MDCETAWETVCFTTQKIRKLNMPLNISAITVENVPA